MTREQFEQLAKETVVRFREVDDVHLLVIAAPLGGDGRPFSAGTLDTATQVHLLRMIANNLEKPEHAALIFETTISDPRHKP